MIKLSFFFSLCMLLCACSFDSSFLSKETMITNYDKFIKDVNKHHEKLDSEDWQDIDKEFKGFVESCYPKFKDDMSVSEKINFWKQTLSYGVYRGSSAGTYQLDVDIDYESEINELSKQGREEIEDFLRKELQPELERTIDDVVKEVDKLGTELKNWLDKL